MALQLPNLDDRTYDDLVEEARSLIPTYAPEWTNHNPSDPGITMIELFAYISEILIYRLNRVTDDHIVSFLKLLNGTQADGSQWTRSGTTPESLSQDIETTLRKLRQRTRAITGQDFEELAVAADPRVARARCLPNRNVQSSNLEAAQLGHVGVILVPKHGVIPDDASEVVRSQILGDIATKVRADLEPRCLLTTRLSVAPAQFLKLRRITVTLVQIVGADPAKLRSDAESRLQAFFSPVDAKNQPNWAFGRSIFASELYQLLDQLPGVDYVSRLDVQPVILDRRIPADPTQPLIRVNLKPYELVAKPTAAEIDITLDRPNP